MSAEARVEVMKMLLSETRSMITSLEDANKTYMAETKKTGQENAGEPSEIIQDLMF